MTLVAVGWPTTFCDRTAVRSSLTSAACLRDRFCPPFGFSTAPSALIIFAALRLTLCRRRCSGGLGSFISVIFLDCFQQFTRTCRRRQKQFCSRVTAPLMPLVAWG